MTRGAARPSVAASQATQVGVKVEPSLWPSAVGHRRRLGRLRDQRRAECVEHRKDQSELRPRLAALEVDDPPAADSCRQRKVGLRHASALAFRTNDPADVGGGSDVRQRAPQLCARTCTGRRVHDPARCSRQRAHVGLTHQVHVPAHSARRGQRWCRSARQRLDRCCQRQVRGPGCRVASLRWPSGQWVAGSQAEPGPAGEGAIAGRELQAVLHGDRREMGIGHQAHRWLRSEKRPEHSRCRGPGSGVHTQGRESQERTTSRASSTGSGRSQARGCPATRMKPVIEGQGSPTVVFRSVDPEARTVRPRGRARTSSWPRRAG